MAEPGINRSVRGIMHIQMIGIDHNTAEVKIREQFSLTATQAARAMQRICSQPGVCGCVLLSTCNRMELYVSTQENGVCLFALLEQAGPFSVPVSEFKQYFTIRSFEETVQHLFYLTAGLCSRIFGEDQILAQVKDAVQRARELGCTDALLEVLFRHAVTAGKEVRARGMLAHTDASTVHCALAAVRQKGFLPEGKQCLVIGNGQMGRLAAEALRDLGAFVTVTVRQYRSGMVEIPKGCQRIHYGERYEKIPSCDLVLSATVSPNLTIRYKALNETRGDLCREQIFIDLAVPRDMEETIAQLEGVTLYDIDDFQSGAPDTELAAHREAARDILMGKAAEFKEWYECRDLIPRMQQIGRQAAEEICWRMGRATGQLSKEQQEMFHAVLLECGHKVVDKLLYTLRDGLSGEELLRCLDVLERIRY